MNETTAVLGQWCRNNVKVTTDAVTASNMLGWDEDGIDILRLIIDNNTSSEKMSCCFSSILV